MALTRRVALSAGTAPEGTQEQIEVIFDRIRLILAA